MEKFRGGEGDFYSVKIINPSNVEQRRKLLKYILFKVMTSRNEKFFFPGLLRLLIDTWTMTREEFQEYMKILDRKF